jgi:S1-C subfamily serine protease
MFPLDDIENVHIFDEVYAVGASLGHPPVASDGHISYMDDEIEHYKYWMSSAPTIFGNSGGAVYRWSDGRKQYEYIGIPSRISIQPMGFSADAITHMGYFIPIDRVYKLLEENDYQFIYDNKVSIEECNKARKKKQKPKKEKEED